MPTPLNQPPRRSIRVAAPGALQRRTTRGPLDLPVSESPTLPSSPIDALSPSHVRQQRSIRQSPSRSPARPLSTGTQPKDFSKLLRPEIYHPLPTNDIVSAFLDPSKRPSEDTPIDILLSSGHFRTAAIIAARRLTTSVNPEDYQTIFELFHVRLACLTLCGLTPLASQEVKCLEDLNSGIYRSPEDQSHLVPWELRVLAVRLQAIGFNDSRKGIVGYYDLARDARGELAKLEESDGFGIVKEQEQDMWRGRLADLGIRVANALVDMGDFEAASHHLETLDESPVDDQLSVNKALLFLRIGNVKAARKCMGDEVTGVIRALCLTADGDYDTAVVEWTALHEKDGDNEMYTQNLAVCLLYAGKMLQARSVLETLVSSRNTFQVLIFNLSTIFELFSDNNRALKHKLAEQIATMSNTNESGWEKTNADFKL